MEAYTPQENTEEDLGGCIAELPHMQLECTKVLAKTRDSIPDTSEGVEFDSIRSRPPNDDDLVVSVPMSRVMSVTSSDSPRDGRTKMRARSASWVPEAPKDEDIDNRPNSLEQTAELQVLIQATALGLDGVFRNWREIQSFSNKLEEICQHFRSMNPGAKVAKVFDLLCDFEQTLEAARADPSILSSPAKCRLGLDAAAFYFSKSIIDRLSVLSTNCAVCKCTIKQVRVTCKRIEDFLNACSKIVADTLQSCQSVGKRFQDVVLVSDPPVHDKRTMPFKCHNCAHILWSSGINMTDFNACIQAWAEVPLRLEDAMAHTRERTDAVEEFLNIAYQEIEEAFQQPYLTSLIQGLLIGEKPQLMQSLLRIIDSVKAVNAAEIIDVIGTLIDFQPMLDLARVRESFRNRILEASFCFDELESQLVTRGCLSNVRVEKMSNASKETFPPEPVTQLQRDFHDGFATSTV